MVTHTVANTTISQQEDGKVLGSSPMSGPFCMFLTCFNGFTFLSCVWCSSVCVVACLSLFVMNAIPNTIDNNPYMFWPLRFSKKLSMSLLVYLSTLALIYASRQCYLVFFGVFMVQISACYYCRFNWVSEWVRQTERLLLLFLNIPIMNHSCSSLQSP